MLQALCEMVGGKRYIRQSLRMLMLERSIHRWLQKYGVNTRVLVSSGC